MKIYKEFVGFYRYKGEVLGNWQNVEKLNAVYFLLNSYLPFLLI